MIAKVRRLGLPQLPPDARTLFLNEESDRLKSLHTPDAYREAVLTWQGMTDQQRMPWFMESRTPMLRKGWIVSITYQSQF